MRDRPASTVVRASEVECADVRRKLGQRSAREAVIACSSRARARSVHLVADRGEEQSWQSKRTHEPGAVKTEKRSCLFFLRLNLAATVKNNNNNKKKASNSQRRDICAAMVSCHQRRERHRGGRWRLRAAAKLHAYVAAGTAAVENSWPAETKQCFVWRTTVAKEKDSIFNDNMTPVRVRQLSTCCLLVVLTPP